MNKSKSGEIPTRRSGSETMSDTQTHIRHLQLCVRVCVWLWRVCRHLYGFALRHTLAIAIACTFVASSP